ncbi:amidase [Tistlia consotensis]|uniref:Amidase n=1 Tax=Tistlia consotensis USBA 355 TaxID=560819 RepID=A0A1Y6C025_9PROT|nr:amidase [Tistlia consotensis]SMF37128.1 amidase [Tistlia consotensis USBA 355]SNR72481.1 amidase [Tistlia consotensis]
MDRLNGLLLKLRNGTEPAPADRARAFVERFELPGASQGPLAGLSFAAKDVFDVAGHRTGCGNPTWAATHPPAAAHAAAVEACLEAGASLRGKTHTDELAYSLMGVNAHHGTPLNGAAPGRVPGGSSSGSAAATAAGLVDFALGSDTGGSVRLPASFCGLYGLRTTHGRVAREGMAPLAPSFDVVGWLARTAWILETVTKGLGLGGRRSPGRPRLLVASDAWALAERPTARALKPVVDRLEDLLGPATAVSLAGDSLAGESLAEWRETFRICQAAEVWQAHGAWIEANAPDFGPGVAERFAAASRVTAAERAEAGARRAAIRRRLTGLLGADGLLVLPTAPGPAPLLTAGAAELDSFRARALELLCPAGLAGLPQVSIPAGLAGGAPVGLSLLGPAGADGTLTEIAASLELFLMVPYAPV